MSSQECHGYRILNVKLTDASSSSHCLYLKEHSVREKCPEKPADRTLFVLGVPPYATEESFKRVFSVCGPVTEVYFHSKPTSSAPLKNTSKFFKDHPEIKGFKVAYVVFQNSLGLSNALSLETDDPLVLSTEETPIYTGIDKWRREYNARILNPEELQREIDSYMEEYDRKIEEEAKRLKGAQEPDDEGWITVSKKGRKPGFSRKESVEKKIMEKEKLKRSKKQLLNFYRFQIRESKMNHIENLRQKFEDDKKKIALMRQSRKFRPY